MTYWTDLYLMLDVDDAAITAAVASALAVNPVNVAVAPYGTLEAAAAGRHAKVVVQRQDLRRFGEGGSWPIELSIGMTGDEPDDELGTLRMIASGLGVPFIVNVEGDGQDMFRVIFPDGHAPARLLNDHDEPTLTADDRRRLTQYDHPVAAAS